MFKPNFDKLRSASSLAALMIALGPSGFAEAAHAQPDNQVNSTSADTDAAADQEIIVTAQFRSQRLQDTPIAITAMSADDLQQRSQQDVVDIANFAPNVNFAPVDASKGSAVSAFIRGIGQFDSSFALEPGVGIYLDDVYLGTTFGTRLDLMDLDRVEVLRGPQGTLAGKNSLGGAVKLFTKKPDDNPEGHVDMTYGSFDRLDLRGSVNLPIADGLYMRVAALSKDSKGYFTRLDYGCVNPNAGISAQPVNGDGCVLGTEGGKNVRGARLALRYAPIGSPLEVNLVGDISDDNSEQIANKLTYANNPNVRSYDPSDPAGGIPFDDRFMTGPESYTSYATYTDGGNFTALGGTLLSLRPTLSLEPKNTAKGWGLAGTIDYQLSDDVSLKSITSYRDARGSANTDLDASPLGLELLGNYYVHKQFSQELRLSAAIANLIDFTVGGFYYRARDLSAHRVSIPASFLDFVLHDPAHNSSKSVFAHSEWHLTPELNLIAGLRYTKDRKSYLFSRLNPDGSLPSTTPYTTNWPVAALNGQSAVYSGDRVDYRVGVNYRWSDALMTYAQVSTGYKGGGVNPRPFNAAQVLPFGPETLTTYEVGFKGDFLGRLLRLDGAAFINKHKGIQLTLSACPTAPCALPANAGDATIKGFELEGSLRPIPGLTIDGAVGYLDFKYDAVNPRTGVQLDYIAPFTSKWTASSSISYRQDLGEVGEITPRLDWTYQSSFYVNALNSPINYIDGRSLFNGRITYQPSDPNWQFDFSVTNIFNKFYYLTKLDFVGMGVATGVVAPPREWSVSVRRSF